MNSKQKALAITSSFEGAGWGGVSDAGDQMGWSAFALQWNFGQSTLQPLIKRMQAAGPATFKRCLTQPVAQLGGNATDLSGDLLHVCDLPVAEAIAWCNARTAGGRPLEHWRKGFAALGAEPGYQAIQVDAAGRYFGTAQEIMAELGFATERALAFCFDLAVQDGSIDGAIASAYRAAVASDEAALKRALTEPEKLVKLAHALVTEVRPQFRFDVLSRKLAIATGIGTVHRRGYDLHRDYQLGDGPVV
jgi:hypothetical protein